VLLRFACGYRLGADSRDGAVVALLKYQRHARAKAAKNDRFALEDHSCNASSLHAWEHAAWTGPRGCSIVFARVDFPICRPEQGEPAITKGGRTGETAEQL